MSELRVNNNMIDYKGTTYNILQINKIQVVEIKGKKSVSFKFLKFTLPFSAILMGVSYFVFANDYLLDINLYEYRNYAISAGLLGLIILFFSLKKVFSLIKNKIYYMYGLSFKMANGENPVFMSRDKDLLFKIRDGIYKAINKESSSINFGNVNIDIADSSNVEIGNIVKR